MSETINNHNHNQLNDKQRIKKEAFVPSIIVERSFPLEGEVSLNGAKNAVLVIMSSLILTKGVSTLFNVPASDDVLNMIKVLTNLGANCSFDEIQNILQVDTTSIESSSISSEIMKKMRASVLIMGPLLARFFKAEIFVPGGCVLGSRPIDYHIKNFEKMGVIFIQDGDHFKATTKKLISRNLLLDYPSVGATENILMAACLTQGTTKIINAALEPEVLDLIDVLKKMGALISIEIPAVISITGVEKLTPIEHHVMLDRLEAGALIFAGAITGGHVFVKDAPAHSMGLVLTKLQEMGHEILIKNNGIGVTIKAIKNPKPVDIKTFPYPGFPTDLQSPMMALLTVCNGTSKVHETVFENRLTHVIELSKMGAQIKQTEYDTAIVTGVEQLFGAHVIATDIRASCSLVLAGLIAHGKTTIVGVNHFKRAYQSFDLKLKSLGANIALMK